MKKSDKEIKSDDIMKAIEMRLKFAFLNKAKRDRFEIISP